MSGLTPLGIFHTVISLVAVGAGLAAFVRDRRIVPESPLGRVYFWTTVITCVTAFGIFQHGGFGKPHALAVLTLMALAVAEVSQRTRWLGRASVYVATVAYSATFLFHMIPAVTETFTRLPVGAPLFANADDPALQKVTLAMLLIFLAGVALQVRRLRATRHPTAAAPFSAI